jgi:hypothetical protein
VRFYLHDHARRIYSGVTPIREIDVISKPIGGDPTGVPKAFREVARVRFERLTLTRYISGRVREIPFYRLHNIQTGFGEAAVVLPGPTKGRP